MLDEDDFSLPEIALPDQGGRKGDACELTEEQRVPRPEIWMSLKEKREWYMQDLLDTFGAEYIGEADLSDQLNLRKNIPKRSSKKKR